MNQSFYKEFVAALLEAWSKETSADSNAWTPQNPAWGQCAVTALLVQDLCGGEILRASLENVQGFESMRSHYWNRLPDGERDFSQSQFPADVYKTISAGEVRTREYLLANEKTKRRYEILKRRVLHILQV